MSSAVLTGHLHGAGTEKGQAELGSAFFICFYTVLPWPAPETEVWRRSEEPRGLIQMSVLAAMLLVVGAVWGALFLLHVPVVRALLADGLGTGRRLVQFRGRGYVDVR